MDQPPTHRLAHSVTFCLWKGWFGFALPAASLDHEPRDNFNTAGLFAYGHYDDLGDFVFWPEYQD